MIHEDKNFGNPLHGTCSFGNFDASTKYMYPYDDSTSFLSSLWYILSFCFLFARELLQVLPVEYGGTGGSLAEITEFWVTEAVKQKDWFARFFELVVLYI